MLFPKLKKEDTNKTVITESCVRSKLDEEIYSRIAELDDKEVTSDAYAAGIKNVKVLSDIRGVYGMTPEKQKQFPDQTVAKIVGVIGTVVLTGFWIGVERNSVVPMRVVNATDKLLKV